jgi:hypothetical protein
VTAQVILNFFFLFSIFSYLIAMEIEERIRLLEEENAHLRKENKSLQERLRYLLQEIERLQVKKDSHNSHNPPSQDKGKSQKRKSLRKKSDRKTGGQKGHKGYNLKMSERPDKIHPLKSNFCNRCGCDLRSQPAHLISRRQVVELPPIRQVYGEYQQFCCTCPACGHEQIAHYPVSVNAPIQFSIGS